MADVNRRSLNLESHITCIEPYPRAFLTAGIPGIQRLIQTRVQEVSMSEFEALNAGDLLFIDSSHVSKTGSDVNFLFLEVLPRLKTGVRIHIHDIALPQDYQKQWVLGEHRSWNEQYLLQALLMYSSGFRVLFGCNYAYTTHQARVARAANHRSGHPISGGSFWIEKIA